MKILFVNPWNYHDEFVSNHDLSNEWRNGPYSMIQLATLLKHRNHEVVIEDMLERLVMYGGDIEKTFFHLMETITTFCPEIIAFSFFSVQYNEVKRAIKFIRSELKKLGLNAKIIIGGIHTTVDPDGSLIDLDVDYVFVGEGEKSLCDFIDGIEPNDIKGVYGRRVTKYCMGDEVEDLNLLPYPDWSLVNYKFYSFPSYGKVKYRKAKTLDITMGRGCIFKCKFCAYGAMSSVRSYSAEYLIGQVEVMIRKYGIDSVYFTDSSVGNYKKTLHEFCDKMIESGLNKKIEWYVNLHPNQSNEKLLKKMFLAGCRFWLYGFESGSQRVLDSMNKKSNLDKCKKIAFMHNKLKYLYHASFIIGYLGETEENVKETIKLISEIKSPIIGINAYVPLPGSVDFQKLKFNNEINIDDTMEWRKYGEVNISKCYASYGLEKLKEYYSYLNKFSQISSLSARETDWAEIFR